MSDLQKHIYAVKRIASRGPVSDDFPHTNREISHHLKVVRNRLLKQKLDKRHSVSPYAYQDLCITLTRGQLSDCPGIVTTECYILKSTVDIPEVLSARWGTAAKPMYIDGRSLDEYNLVNQEYRKYSLLNGVGKLKDKWLIYNKRLIVLSEKDYDLQKLMFSAIFVDPEEVFYDDISDCPAAGDFVDFTIDPELVDPMYDMVLQRLLNSLKFTRDDENNAKGVEVSQQDIVN